MRLWITMAGDTVVSSMRLSLKVLRYVIMTFGADFRPRFFLKCWCFCIQRRNEQKDGQDDNANRWESVN
jgi:hypothetical protein